MIKVLIIDDSAFMRNTLKRMIESDQIIKVIDTARNGNDGLEKILKLNPDIVTLDVQMPGIDGLTLLKRIMELHPLPVLMLSSANHQDAEIILKAMQLGAADFIPKDLSQASLDILKIQELIIEKIKAVAQNKNSWIYHRQASSTQNLPHSCFGHGSMIEAVAIGTSTGGPFALEYICTRLPKNLATPVLVAQHMPPTFTGPFANRLNSCCQLEVREAQQGEVVTSGVVYIAPGRKQMRVRRKLKKVVIDLSDQPVTLYMPSVDILLSSISETYGHKSLAVILTGMGRDGLEGVRQIKDAHGLVIAEHKDTCVVYGMPKGVINEGLADRILPLPDIPKGIVEALSIPRLGETY